MGHYGDAVAYGSHTETSIREPSLRWYLAEGSTIGGFNLFYLESERDCGSGVRALLAAER
jgi:hypothetical protein